MSPAAPQACPSRGVHAVHYRKALLSEGMHGVRRLLTDLALQALDCHTWVLPGIAVNVSTVGHPQMKLGTQQ